MSRERSISPLTGDDHRVIAAIERDLERLLSVEPSPDFAQRVRTRIADGNAVAGTPGWRYGLAAAAALVALVATGVLLTRSQDPPAALPVVTMAPQETRAATGAAASARAAAGARVAAGKNDAGVRVEATSVAGSGVAVSPRIVGRLPRIATGAGPEVLVPDEQRVALRRLLDMARAGTLDERVFPSEAQTAPDREPGQSVAPIVIEDLQVPPLIIIEGAGVEGSAGGTGLGHN